MWLRKTRVASRQIRAFGSKDQPGTKQPPLTWLLGPFRFLEAGIAGFIIGWSAMFLFILVYGLHGGHVTVRKMGEVRSREGKRRVLNVGMSLEPVTWHCPEEWEDDRGDSGLYCC